MSEWEKYVEQAADEITYHPGNRTGTPESRHPVSVMLARAVLAAVGPLIQEDTRDRMVTAAAASLEWDGGQDERAKIVADLRFLAEARKDYCHRCPEHQGDMHEMGPTALAVHDDHSAAERLADIIEGSNSAKGWLPSWRWDEWKARLS